MQVRFQNEEDSNQMDKMFFSCGCAVDLYRGLITLDQFMNRMEELGISGRAKSEDIPITWIDEGPTDIDGLNGGK